MTHASLLGIFISTVVENMGIPFPIEASYIAACLLIEQGRPYALFLLVLTAGHVGGSLMAYFIGLRGEEYFRRRWGHKPKLMAVSDRLHGWFLRYGAFAVFLTRFVGYVRPWSSFVAGFARVNLGVFVFWTFLGTLLFNIMLLEITARFLHFWMSFQHSGVTIGLTIACLLSLFLLLKLFGRYLFRLEEYCATSGLNAPEVDLPTGSTTSDDEPAVNNISSCGG
ncbi:MAG: VTT domain-containing protein [Bacillota bacterium]